MSDLVERREAQPFTAEQMRMIERALTANGYPDSGAVIDDDDLFEVIQIAVSVLLPGIRAEVLTEAYWKLRVHSSQMFPLLERWAESGFVAFERGDPVSAEPGAPRLGMYQLTSAGLALAKGRTEGKIDD